MYPMHGVREIDRQECPRLMATAPVGRIVHTPRALAAVLPVPFSLYADSLAVVRTSAVSQLAGAIGRAVIALQADTADRAVRSGWSVVDAARATVVSDLAECERVRERGPRSWRTSHHIFFPVEPELVSGTEPGERRMVHDARRTRGDVM
ncbi:pyridoxamine 5'-phosphate oxidase family protein [Streptomyces sp. NBC_00569]|nr:pyridoxamine 5'-phosphate oxidase family protein [Streptomyces sp. NBC_00063]WUB99734.1 pyridoxamine 5'-phosphate oxidase family protein [Streptomyces sp. NBC_00569]